VTAAELFDDAGMAAGYATDRPPVHPHLVDHLRASWHPAMPVRIAVDVGCGAGASTAALQGWASVVVGIDPFAPMIRAARAAVAGPLFAVAAAERLPWAGASVDLLAAAGSLNYADLDAFVAEADRVLRPEGAIAISNYSFGRPEAPGANSDWSERFAAQFPRPGSSIVDATSFAAGPFRPTVDERFTVTLPMRRDAYLAYVMTDTGVARAVADGTDPSAARTWCAEALAHLPVGEGPVAFDCTLLVLVRSS
jgi:SAM-dependent methyltransferase